MKHKWSIIQTIYKEILNGSLQGFLLMMEFQARIPKSVKSLSK